MRGSAIPRISSSALPPPRSSLLLLSSLKITPLHTLHHLSPLPRFPPLPLLLANPSSTAPSPSTAGTFPSSSSSSAPPSAQSSTPSCPPHSPPSSHPWSPSPPTPSWQAHFTGPSSARTTPAALTFSMLMGIHCTILLLGRAHRGRASE